MTVETLQNEAQEKSWKTEQHTSELCDYFKQTNICIIGVPEEHVINIVRNTIISMKIFEKTMAQTFSNFVKL